MTSMTENTKAVECRDAEVERIAQAIASELYGPPDQQGNSLTRAAMLTGIRRALARHLAQPAVPEGVERGGSRFDSFDPDGLDVTHRGRTLSTPQPAAQESVEREITVPADMLVSVDVSQGEDDAQHRIFARTTGEVIQYTLHGRMADPVILAIEESRNFSTPQPESAQGERGAVGGWTARWHKDGDDSLILLSHPEIGSVGVHKEPCEPGRPMLETMLYDFGVHLLTTPTGDQNARAVDDESPSFKAGFDLGRGESEFLCGLIRDPKCVRCGARNAQEAETLCRPSDDSCPGVEWPLEQLWSLSTPPAPVAQAGDGVAELRDHVLAMTGWFDTLAEKVGWTRSNALAAFLARDAAKNAALRGIAARTQENG